MMDFGVGVHGVRPGFPGRALQVHHPSHRLLPIRQQHWQRFHAKASFPTGAAADKSMPSPTCKNRPARACGDCQGNRLPPKTSLAS
jgi:hypothetical protein